MFIIIIIKYQIIIVMLEILILNYKSVFKIFTYTTMIIIIYMFLFRKNILRFIDKNWKSYKNNPVIIILIGLLDPSSEKIVNQGLIKLFSDYIKPYLKDSFSPINKIFDLFLNGIKHLKENLNSIRNQISTVRNLLLEFYKKMVVKVKHNYTVVLLSFLKIQDSLKKSYHILTTLIYNIENSYQLLESMINSPINNFGKIAEKYGLTASVSTFGEAGIPLWHGALCFSPNTKIITNNKLNSISEAKVNDILENNNKILAKIITKSTSDLYNLDNILVSGDHMVLDNSKFIRVCEVDRSKKLLKNKTNELVSLITSDGVLKINNNIFKDYLDTHDRNINKAIRKYIFQSLNSEYCDENNSGCDNLISGIDPDIKILNYKDIIGYVEIAENTLDIYKYHNLYLSGNILIYHMNSWKRICNLKCSKYIGKNKNIFRHYISYNSRLNTGQGIIRDFCEISENKVNQTIDNFVDRHINLL